MAQINLLPWREQLRQDKNKQFKRMLVFSVVAAMLLAVLVWSYLYYLQRQQQAAMTYLNEQLVLLDEAIANIEQAKQQQEKIEIQREAIEALHYQRTLLPRIWNDIANSVPQSLYLTGLTQAEGVITLTGNATSASAVTNWVKVLTGSNWLQQVQLHYVKQSTSLTQSEPPTESRYPFQFVVTAVPIEARLVAETVGKQLLLAHIQPSPIVSEPAQQSPLSPPSDATGSEVTP